MAPNSLGQVLAELRLLLAALPWTVQQWDCFLYHACSLLYSYSIFMVASFRASFCAPDTCNFALPEHRQPDKELWSTAPVEVLETVASLLNYEERCSMRATCSHWRSAVQLLMQRSTKVTISNLDLVPQDWERLGQLPVLSTLNLRYCSPGGCTSDHLLHLPRLMWSMQNLSIHGDWPATQPGSSVLSPLQVLLMGAVYHARIPRSLPPELPISQGFRFQRSSKGRAWLPLDELSPQVKSPPHLGIGALFKLALRRASGSHGSSILTPALQRLLSSGHTIPHGIVDSLLVSGSDLMSHVRNLLAGSSAGSSSISILDISSSALGQGHLARLYTTASAATATAKHRSRRGCSDAGCSTTFSTDCSSSSSGSSSSAGCSKLLQKLELVGMNLQTLTILPMVLARHNLKSLTLSTLPAAAGQQRQAVFANLPAMLGNMNLRSLTLHGRQLLHADLASTLPAAIAKNQGLLKLRLVDAAPTTAGAVITGSLAVLSSLQHLKISYTKPGPLLLQQTATAALDHAVQTALTCLTRLNLCGCSFLSMSSLQHLFMCSGLQQLDISWVGQSEQDAALPWPNNQGVMPIGFMPAALPPLGMLSKLRSLSVANTDLDDNFLTCLSNLQRLTSLDASHSGLREMGSAAVARLQRLQHLDLSGCYLLQPMAIIVADSCPRLRTLVLHSITEAWTPFWRACITSRRPGLQLQVDPEPEQPSSSGSTAAGLPAAAAAAATAPATGARSALQHLGQGTAALEATTASGLCSAAGLTAAEDDPSSLVAFLLQHGRSTSRAAVLQTKLWLAHRVVAPLTCALWALLVSRPWIGPYLLGCLITLVICITTVLFLLWLLVTAVVLVPFLVWAHIATLLACAMLWWSADAAAPAVVFARDMHKTFSRFTIPRLLGF